MKKLYIQLLFALFILDVTAQTGTENYVLGRNMAIPYSGLGFHNNPAQLPAEKAGLGLFYNNRFAGTNLNYGAVHGHLRKNNFSGGVSLSQAGTNYLGLWRAELIYGMAFSKKISIGVALGADMNKQYDAYRDERKLFGKLGFHSIITESSTLDIVVQDPWYRNSLSGYQDPQIHFAYCYRVKPGSMLYVHAKNSGSNKTIAGIGISHTIKKIKLTAGIQNGPEPLGAGVLLSKSNCEFGIASSYHIYLGFVPSLQFRVLKF